MSSSQNEAGIAIETTEVGKRTTRNSRGVRRELFPDATVSKTQKRATSSKSNTNHYNTCYGRFSTTKRQEELMAGSPHSAEKLKRLGIDLRINTVADSITPLSPRQTRDILKLEIDGSPVRVQMRCIPPSPAAQSYYPNPKQPSPRTVSRAQKIQAPQDAEKICEADTRLTSFNKGKKTSRTIPVSEFNGISAQILNTLYGDIGHIRIRKEYLHGIDRSSGGRANQENLFVASRDANSQMIPLDDAKKRFLEEGLCQQIHTTVKSTLQTKANSSELTHISKEIEIAYYVDSTGLKISAVIDANTTERPSVQERKMVIDFLLFVQRSLLAQQAAMQKMPPADTPDSKEEMGSCEEALFVDSLSDTVANYSDECLLSSFEEILAFDSLSEDMLSNDDPLNSSVDMEYSTGGIQESSILITLQLEYPDLLEKPHSSDYQSPLYHSMEYDSAEDSFLDPADMVDDHVSLVYSADTHHHSTATKPTPNTHIFESFAAQDENASPNISSSCSFFAPSSQVKKSATPQPAPHKIYQTPSIPQ